VENNVSPVDTIITLVSSLMAALSKGLDKIGFAIAAPGYYSATRFTRGRIFLKEYFDIISNFTWPEPSQVYSEEAGFIPPSLDLLFKQRLPLMLGKSKALIILLYHVTGFENPILTLQRLDEIFSQVAMQGHVLAILMLYGMTDDTSNIVSELMARTLVKMLRSKGIPAQYASINSFDKILSTMLF